MDISVAAGVMIPFIGTTLGSAMVFFMRNQINKKIEKLLMGFAAGVMVAASSMVASHSGNRHGGRAGKGCMDTGSSGIYFRNGIFAAFGQCDTALASGHR